MNGNSANIPQILFSLDDQKEHYLVEGDCACPTWHSAIQPRDLPLPIERPLRQSPAIIAPVNHDFSTVLTHVRPGGIAVLNAEALSLWHLFRHSRTVSDALGLDRVQASETASLAAIQRLWARGFLTAASIPEPSTTPSPTLLVWLHVTNACNLRCSYCFVDTTPEFMDEGISQLAIDAVFRSALTHRYRNVKLKYSGGESLLNFKRVLSTHKYAQSIADNLSIQLQGVVLTNGVRLTDRVIADLRDHDLALMISLDGVGEAHDAQRKFVDGRGTFDLVERGIKVARAGDLIPSISITITERNAPYLAATLEWILAHNLPFSLNFYRENGLADRHMFDEQRMISDVLRAFRVIEDNLPQHSLLASLTDRADLSVAHDRPCAVGQDYLVIDQHGRIAKCHMLLAHSITDVYARDPLALLRADQVGIQNPLVTDKMDCSACEWKFWCAGGCPITAFNASGGFNGRTPYCKVYQAIFPEVVRLEALRLLKYYSGDYLS